MTFEARVQALTYLGLTPRQTRFLVTVALHSGFCVRRQFAAFGGVKYGKNVRHFLDALVDRGLGHRLAFEINRGHIYHLHARAVYRAIGQDDNRNRRTAAPALIARKLMLLDFVLAQRADEWVVTEQDKVVLFNERFGIARVHLPHRIYASADRHEEAAGRYFIDKLPIFLAGDPQTVHFVFLATEAGAHAFARFLGDHRAVLTRVPRWAVVLVRPPYAADTRTFQAMFDAFITGSQPSMTPAVRAELRWFFTTRRAAEEDNLPTLSVAVINRFQAARRRLAGARVESLYADWLTEGDVVFGRLERGPRMPVGSSGTLLTHDLPFSYTQFGKLPGVA